MTFDNPQQKQLVLQALNTYSVPLGQSSALLKLCQGVIDGDVLEPVIQENPPPDPKVVPITGGKPDKTSKR